MAQAGGFDFEKLAKQVGAVCAKLIIEGSVGQMLDAPKKRQFVKWANHKFTRGQEISTTTVLAELVKKFQETEIELLTESVSESIGGDYARLVISKPKPGTESTLLPNYWKPGIESELKLTPEQTIKYHQQLMALGWYKTTEQGQPYWNRPQRNASRTGETTLAGAIKN